jgi:hypothetical protein
LESICLKCMAKKPEHRYASAEELANKLKEYRQEIIRAYVDAAKPLLALAVFFAVAHLAVFGLICGRGPQALIWLAIITAYLPLFAVLEVKRPLAVSKLVHRQLIDIWIGHLLAGLAIFISHQMAGATDAYAGFLNAYPSFAALTALAFIVMGAVYWRWFYLVGGTCLLAACVMPLASTWSPVVFGGLIAGGTAMSGLYLLRLARQLK